MKVYFVTPIYQGDKFKGREIMFGMDTNNIHDIQEVKIMKDFPLRYEVYDVWKVLIYGNEAFVITHKKPKMVEYLAQ